MRRDEHIRKLEFSDEFLLDSAEKRLQDGDYFGALSVLNKRSGMYEPSADASALYADVYEALELWQLAADAWFRFLDTCNEADFSEGYEGLAVAFMNMGNDVQSAIYYHRALNASAGETDEEEEEALEAEIEEISRPNLRIVHSEEGDPEMLQRGLGLLKAGELESARAAFAEIPPTAADYPSAAGLSAMCTLMLGDEDGAEQECLKLLATHPENIQALTTYCAVLDSRGNKAGAREIARKLSEISSDSVEDLYRVTTALCETGMDEEAFEKLVKLKRYLPYDADVLYFHAVAGYRTGKLDEAISSLETLTALYPRKAVAAYYLVNMRRLREGEGERFPMNYYYRVPEKQYRALADYFLKRNAAEPDEEALAALADSPELAENFRLAFDEMEGRDEKLQIIAARVADKCRADALLREILLDCNGNELVKLSVLHDLTERNEDNSFGAVVCNLYKEFFTHKLEIGRRKYAPFMKAFADVYAKYALLGEENEGKICAAAEDLYQSLAEAGAWDYMDERSALAAAIYRESRLRRGVRDIGEIAKMFDAPLATVKSILNYMI